MAKFEIKDKVALVTGGVSGLGFHYALALLKKGARGVTLIDVNTELAKTAMKEIETKFGENKAIFVKADITKYEEFEDAFKKTVEVFKNIDIVINNAGITNDAIWEKEIAINVNGTIHGVLLGLDNYLPKYKSGSEGLIVNIASLAAFTPHSWVPIYAGTKFAVHGLTLSWGLPVHYDRTKVRVVGVCPGGTKTPLGKNIANSNLGPAYENIRISERPNRSTSISVQTPEQAAPKVMQVIEKAPNGTMWIVEDGEPPYQYKMPSREEMPKVYLN